MAGHVRFVTENFDWATRPAKDVDNLEHLVDALYRQRPANVSAIVFGAQEARNFRLAALLLTIIRTVLRAAKIRAPKVVQGTGPSRSGTALAAFGTKLYHPRLILTAGANRITRARWMTRAGVDVRGGRVEVFVVHIKPPRAGRPSQLTQLRKVVKFCKRARARKHGWVVLADFNLPSTLVAKVLGGTYYGTPRGIGIVASSNVDVARHGSDSYGEDHKETDHPAVYVDVAGVK